MKSFPDQRWVDFVAEGVWAIKFASVESYKEFHHQYKKCLFENTYGFEDNDENKVGVFGKDFMAWAKPESADDMIWEDADDRFERTPKKKEDVLEEFEEESHGGGIQSLALVLLITVSWLGILGFKL